MKTMTEKQTAIICTAGVLAIAMLIIPLAFSLHGGGSGKRSVVWVVFAAVIALGMVLGSRYLTAGRRAQIELEGHAQYRQLADEYRRLADLAITAQEHTDLKLGEVNVQLDYLRTQNESLQKILRDVE